MQPSTSSQMSGASNSSNSAPALAPHYEAPGVASANVYQSPATASATGAPTATYDSLNAGTRVTAPVSAAPEYSHLNHGDGAPVVYSSLDDSSRQTSFHSSATGIYNQLDRDDPNVYSGLAGSHSRAHTDPHNPHLYDRLH